ncbi:MAG: hypothetical protein ACRC6P_20130 [Shewanella oncorhynchi]
MGKNMKLKFKMLFLHVMYLCLCYFYLFERAGHVTIDLPSLFASLIAVSSVIMAILGMWISYSYPNTRNSVVQENDNIELASSLDGAKKLESMIMAVMASAFVIAACLISSSVIFPLIDTYNLDAISILYIKSIKFCFVWYLCFFQVYSLMHVVKLNFDFLDKLDILISRLKLQKKQKKG